jgi:putative transposase
MLNSILFYGKTALTDSYKENQSMSHKYKPGEDQVPHFVTITVVEWIDIFSREIYKEIFLECLRYCIIHKGLKVHAWVIMTNHVHLIISSQGNKIADIVRDLKKFTSREIIDMIAYIPNESRRDWMLSIFRFTGSRKKNDSTYQLWQFGYHPVELSSNKMLGQRLKYIHENPVKSGLVWEPCHYKYSSAVDYFGDGKGLLEIEIL